MDKEKVVRLYFSWSQSNIDPIQYKPWSPTFLPESIKVAIDIPDDEKYIVSSKEGAVILTPCGMAYVHKLLANAIALEYRKE